MEIKKELPSFEGKGALIIVSGKQSGQIYYASNKEINLLEEWELETPSKEYTDNEGHFKRGKNGEFMASGNVLEPKKQYLVKKFSNDLNERIVSVLKKEKASEIYLFCPEYMKNEIKNEMRAEIKTKIAAEFSGNFVDMHIFKLLEKINQEEETGSKTLKSKKASDLLHRNEIT